MKFEYEIPKLLFSLAAPPLCMVLVYLLNTRDSQNTPVNYGVSLTDQPKFPASFWFIKTHKAGGSTLAGIFRAVAAHHGVQMINPPSPGDMRFLAGLPDRLDPEIIIDALENLDDLGTSHFGIANHMPWQELEIEREYQQFTVVREPADRILSSLHSSTCSWLLQARNHGDMEYYCPQGFDAVIQNLEKFQLEGLHMTKETLPSQVRYVLGKDEFDEEAAERLDFIFVTERMDESLVAFKILFGLSWDDVAHLSSKVIIYERMQDMSVAKQTAVMKVIEKLPSYKEDVKFHRYADEKLDRIIVEIEKTSGSFYAQLDHFQRLQGLIRARCSDEAVPVGERGTRFQDNGRNFRCVERVARTSDMA